MVRPIFCAIFPDLLDYVSYKALNKLSSELDLFTILVQKAEFDKEWNLQVDDETMDKLSNTLAKVAKSGGCGASHNSIHGSEAVKNDR